MNKWNYKTVISHRLFWPLICLAIVLMINLIFTPDFFKISIQNGVLFGYLIDVINRSSELIVMAVGMTLVVASSGGTDISVGAVSAVAGAVCVYALGTGESYQLPYGIAILLAAMAGIVCGAWNGFLVAKMKIQPMVATLILFTAGRGIAQLITGGFNLYVKVPSYKYLGNFLPHVVVPTPIFIAIIVVLITAVVLRKTALGIYIQTVGINSRAGRLVGLNSTRIQFLTYTFCGLCSAIAGMIISSRIGSIDANNVGLYMELDAILAVALGGNALSGGKFSLIGSVIGAITIQALTTSLYAMNVTADQLPVYKAVVVVIIVSLQSEELKKWMHHIKVKITEKSGGKKVAE